MSHTEVKSTMKHIQEQIHVYNWSEEPPFQELFTANLKDVFGLRIWWGGRKGKRKRKGKKLEDPMLRKVAFGS